ncbi:MAG: hypothetical protein QGH60_09980, partial [Phycisphaerae bacterium]|nr:hypothetical protein [Phycisphaerae bacterium]
MRIESLRHSPLTHVIIALVCVAIFGGACPTAEAGGVLEIPAWSFDRGNARVIANPHTYADYQDMYPHLLVTGGDKLPWTVEYDLDLPVSATYTLKVRYSSDKQQPIEIWLDGKKIATACGRVTGDSGAYPDRFPRHDRPRPVKGFHGAEWDTACKLVMKVGKHTLKLTRKGPPPGVAALRLESSELFPGKWKPTAPAVIPNERGTLRYKGRHRYQQAFGKAN